MDFVVVVSSTSVVVEVVVDVVVAKLSNNFLRQLYSNTLEIKKNEILIIGIFTSSCRCIFGIGCINHS